MSDIELNIMNGKRLDDLGEIQMVLDLADRDETYGVLFIKHPDTGEWYILVGQGGDEDTNAGIYSLSSEALMPSILEAMLRDASEPIGVKRDEIVAVIGSNGDVRDVGGTMHFERWAQETDHDPFEKRAEAARREFYAERDDG